MPILTKQKKMDLLVSCLNDENEIIRLHAMDLLIQSGLVGMTRCFIRLIEDPSAMVRSRVALALGNSNDKAVSPYLVKLLDDVDDGVKESALNALGRLKPDNINEIIKKAIYDSSSSIQKKAIDMVKEHNVVDLANDVITIVLVAHSKDVVTKANEAILFLAKSNLGVPFLNFLLSYDSSKGGYRKTYSPIDKYAVNSTSDTSGFGSSASDAQDIESVRERYYATLKKVGNQAIMANIIDIINSSQSFSVKANAVKTIGEIEYRDAVNTVTKALLREEDTMFRRQTVRTLGIIGNSAVVDTLLDLMSRDESVLWEASEALGKLKDLRAVNSLVELLLHNESDNIRKTAALALCNFKDNRAIKPLMMAFVNDSFVRPYLSLSFRQVGDHRIVEFLIGLLHQDDEDIKYHAVVALGDLESSYAIYSLVGLITDDSERVREAAVESLSKINNVSIFEDMLIVSVVSEEEKIISKVQKIVTKMAADSMISDRIVNLYRSTSPQKPIKERAIETLRVTGDNKLIEFLNKKLISATNSEKCNAIKILGHFGDESISNKLIQIVEDKGENQRVREAAMDSIILGNLGENLL